MRNKRNIFRKNPLFEKCPSCGNYNTLHRSHARSLRERLVKNFTPYKKYRCGQCGWRGYRSTLNFSRGSAKVIIFYIGLIVVVAWLVKQILGRFMP